jgi:hypothetical protein
VSLPYALHISSFLLFFDLCMRWTGLEPVYTLKLSNGRVFPLALTLAFLLVIYGILARAVPIVVWGLFSLKNLFWIWNTHSPFRGKGTVPDYQYERYAVETHNGTAFEYVRREQAEHHRFIGNGGLFLLWIWLGWGEMTFCLPKSGTMGNLVFPMQESRGIVGIGFLICLGITLLWTVLMERECASLQVPVSPKMYQEIQEREKVGELKKDTQDRNQEDSVPGLSYPMQPMIKSRTLRPNES